VDESVRVIDPRLQRPLDYAEERLESEAASGRFTELFAEMLTVAVVAQEAYGDPELTEEEIDSYLDHSLSIFNSFRHPRAANATAALSTGCRSPLFSEAPCGWQGRPILRLVEL
jgi:hypothetical protein